MIWLGSPTIVSSSLAAMAINSSCSILQESEPSPSAPVMNPRQPLAGSIGILVDCETPTQTARNQKSTYRGNGDCVGSALPPSGRVWHAFFTASKYAFG